MSLVNRILLGVIVLLYMPALAAEVVHPCVPVAGDRIRGTDLIAAGLSAEPALDLGPAPMPGLARTIRADQPFGGTCFEVRTTPIAAETIEAAMRKTLGAQDARIEILEFSQVSTPNATLEFTRASLPNPPAATPEAPVVWRGRAIAGNRHSQPIWARVKLSVETTSLETAHEITAGTVLSDSDVKQKSAWTFPSTQPELSTSDVIGLAAMRRIPANSKIDRRTLTMPNMVESGQVIEVRVISSAALLQTTAVAERAGKLGEIIMAKNDQSGKRFRAKITGPGQAVVVVAERI